MKIIIAVLVLVAVLAIIRVINVRRWRGRQIALQTAAQKKQEEEKRRILLEAQKKVRYLTIRELREGLQPGLTEKDYIGLSYRMSIRSALLALKKLGLVPAVKEALEDMITPEVEGEEFIAFPGKLIPCDRPGSEGSASYVLFSITSVQVDGYMGIGFDLHGNSRVAAVEPGSLLAGAFPIEWQVRWNQGLTAMRVQTLAGEVRV